MLEDLAFTSHRELFKNIYEQKAKHNVVPIGKGKSRIDRYSPWNNIQYCQAKIQVLIPNYYIKIKYYKITSTTSALAPKEVPL